MKIFRELSCLLLFSGLACGQSITSPGSSFVVADDETKQIDPGGYDFNAFELGKNATLIFTESTTIHTARLKTSDGAKIEYKPRPNSAAQSTAVLTIAADDGAGLTNLSIIGNGSPVRDYKLGETAARGGNGKNARWNHLSSNGKSGAAGQKGARGGEAADVVLMLPDLKPTTTIHIEAIGGNGGRGQDGGQGGKGGSGSSTHAASRGGNGGAAGEGGDGGSSGHISVTLVLAPSETAKKDEVLRNANDRIQLVYGGGNGGEPGMPGAGGWHGNRGGGVIPKINESQSERGSDGKAANAGKPGDGPRQGEKNLQWANIDVTDLQTYQNRIKSWGEEGTGEVE